MATEIPWEDVVGKLTLDDGGRVGDLLTVARAHIDDAVAKSRLTKAQAGDVYVQMIPAAFQQGMEFAMNQQIVVANTDKAIFDADAARVAADREYVLMLASVDKEYGYNYVLDADGYVIRAQLTDAGDGKIDAEVDLAKANVKLTNRKTI